MGNVLKKRFKRLFRKKNMNILMLGLDGSGKTTMLYKLKLQEAVFTIPTMALGFTTHGYALGAWPAALLASLAGFFYVVESFWFQYIQYILPHKGFNVETIQYKNVNFTVWDVGGQKIMRTLWHHHFSDAQGLVFVVDSADQKRLMLARKELRSVLADDNMKDVVVLIFANKQDIAGALNAQEIAYKLGLFSLNSRNWHVQPCCAKSGIGLHKGLHWLRKQLKTKRRIPDSESQRLSWELGI